jgi:probable HAF family extracellular repeat protein
MGFSGTTGMIGLGDLPGGNFDSTAWSVSADGLVIVGTSESAASAPYHEAFRWTAEEGMVGLGNLPETLFQSVANAVSEDGSIIVGSSCLSPPGPLCFDRAPIIWDAAHGMRNLRDVLSNGYGLDLGGWTLGAARGLSADGLTIVGYGVNPNGDAEAWLLRLPDCNGNGIADDLDIFDGISTDGNGDHVPDECEEDCNGNGQADSDDIKDGTSDDCNDNAIPDECEADCNGNDQQDTCDIDQGVSEDCDANLIPDECIDPEYDCNANLVPDACDIEDGSSADCNDNGVPDDCIDLEDDCNTNQAPDSCDIADGTSTDCDDNAVPDECDPQPDCNENGISDFCDIADGTSTDCDGSAVPDECEEWADCNANGQLDSCDIAEGSSVDCGEPDGVPDECCLGDPWPGDNEIGPPELSLLLFSWGACPDPCMEGIPSCQCPADFDRNCTVNAYDLALLLHAWGPCPPTGPAGVVPALRIWMEAVMLAQLIWQSCSEAGDRATVAPPI